MQLYPDRIWRNGRIRTMRREGEWHAALASMHGRIVALGSDQEVLATAGPDTDIIDLESRCVLPGFFDSHTHLLKGARAHFAELDLVSDPPSSIDDLLSSLSAYAAEAPSHWVVANGVRAELVAEKRYPTRWDLDRVLPDRPTVVRCPGSHVIAANSRALALAGIDQSTTDPTGGRIDRDPTTGEPTGVLREMGKLRLSDRHPESVLPRLTEVEGVDALRSAAQDLFLPMGITSTGAILVDDNDIRTASRACLSNELALRISMYLRVVETPLTLDKIRAIGLVTGFGDSRIKFGGVKVSIDGGTLHRQALMHEHHKDEPTNFGVMRISQEDLDSLAVSAHSGGDRLLIHAIGDRAGDMALQAIRKAVSAGPPRDHRHRVEHLGNLGTSDAQIGVASELGVIASPQPAFLWEYGDEWIDIYGWSRLGRAGSFRSLLEAGVVVIGSSDYTVTNPSPLVGIGFAVTRRTKHGTVICPEESVSVFDAVSMYTRNAAYAEFAERERGTIRLGGLTDLAILSDDPFQVSPSSIASTSVTSTVIDGSVVYGE